MKRTGTPERRWIKRWHAAYLASGGFGGDATMQAQRVNALRYYHAGATAESSGLFCAEQYRLHSALGTAEEWAQGMSEDIQSALAGNLAPLEIYRREKEKVA